MKKKFRLWKSSFKQYCELPAHQDCLIEDDFAYLESKGLLGIGNYDTLIDIFRYDSCNIRQRSEERN